MGELKVKLLVFVMLLVLMAACERETTVKLEGGNPPSFVLTGSGNLGAMTIYGPESEQAKEPFGDTGALWKIVPEAGYLKGTRVERLHSITYGVVPQGYKQVIPENNESPLPLVTGTRYSYWFDTTNAPHAGGSFEIRNGQATHVEGLRLCFDFRDGKWLRIPCNK